MRQPVGLPARHSGAVAGEQVFGPQVAAYRRRDLVQQPLGLKLRMPATDYSMQPAQGQGPFPVRDVQRGQGFSMQRTEGQRRRNGHVNILYKIGVCEGWICKAGFT